MKIFAQSHNPRISELSQRFETLIDRAVLQIFICNAVDILLAKYSSKQNFIHLDEQVLIGKKIVLILHAVSLIACPNIWGEQLYAMIFGFLLGHLRLLERNTIAAFGFIKKHCNGTQRISQKYALRNHK